MAVLVKLAWGQRFAIGSDLVAPRFEASRGGQHVENRVGWYQSNPLNIGKRGGTTFVDTWCDLVVSSGRKWLTGALGATLIGSQRPIYA